MGITEVILLDTHVVVWIALDPSRLSKKAAAAIDDARKHGGGLAISAITLLELAHLVARGRIRVDVSLESFLEEVESRFVIQAVSARIAALSVQLPDAYPRDPMDRLIGATALAEGMPLVTADEQIRKAKVVKTIW